MTNKERLLNAIAGKEVDRTPWAPFLIYWWESQPCRIRDMSEIGMYRAIGADPLIRGHYPTQNAESAYRDLFMVDMHYRNCEISEHIRGTEKIKRYETKVGTLESRYRTDPSSNTWFLVEHPLKTCEDYKVLQYIMRNVEVTPDYSGYESVVRQYGDEILLTPIVSPILKTAFQSMFEHWAGTFGMVDMLEEEPELVEETLNAIRDVNRKCVQICSESDAEAFITFEDSSTTNYSPRLYKEYALPEINDWCDILHKENKLLIQHACGHIKHLLPVIAESKIDCLESVTPLPTGNVTMAEVAAALPERISIIGGIDPIMMLSNDWEPLGQYACELLATMKGRSFILSNSDSLPPGVKQEYLQNLSKLVR